MFGGQEQRWSQNYDIKTDSWNSCPKLPAGHNITVNIAVNYQDSAIFSFIMDAQLTIKSAVMDLKKMTMLEQSQGNQHGEEMDWALILP